MFSPSNNSLNERVRAWMGLATEDYKRTIDEAGRHGSGFSRASIEMMETKSSQTLGHDQAGRWAVYRERNTCPITREGDLLRPFHICPFRQGRDRVSPSNMDARWFYLTYFWPEEKVAAWERALKGANTTDSDTDTSKSAWPHTGEGPIETQYLVSMTTQAYGYWKDARFALQPISRSEDGKSLAVKFRWMPPGTEYDCMPATDIPEFSANIDSAPRGGKLYNTETELKIVSGKGITFHTEDSIKVPLPSWKLFEMQWIMHRIAGLLGLKETFEQEWEDYPSGIEYEGALYRWKR